MNGRHAANLARADRFAGIFAPAVVDLFAGCGGWSIGAEQAFCDGGYRDRYIDLAVNHWGVAVGVHWANHPMTDHLHASVFEVDPNAVLPGRKVVYLHASPDCTDFSKAKGSRPKRKHIRALADVVIVWAGKRRPDVITLENVEEFKEWGPLRDDGQPCPVSRGAEFARWVGELRGLGYAVEWRELRACDYGAPTTRKRLYVIARCDGKPIVWPEATHGPGEADRGVVRPVGGRVRRPSEAEGLRLADPVRRGRRRVLKPYRTAAECIDWSIPMLSIFATPAEAAAFARRHGIGVPRRPLKDNTLRRIARGVMKYVVNARRPFIVNIQNYGWGSTPVAAVDRPLPTITGNPKGGAFAVADVTLAPFAATLNHGGPESRANGVDRPLATVCGANDARALVAAMISKHYGGVVGHAADAPVGTVTGIDHHAVTCAFLSNLYGTNKGGGGDLTRPAPTVTGSSNHPGLVAAFLATYYGNGGEFSPADSLPTCTGRDRISLVTVVIDGQTYVVTDVAMRMLTPRELARAQGFPDDYVIDRTIDGRAVSKADQVKLIGNSVCPPVARAIVTANVVDQGLLEESAAPAAGVGA